METLPNVIHKSWHPHLFSVFQTPAISHIKNKLLKECEFNPKGKDIFNVFSMPMDKVKVVILGQDPYPTPSHAIGYAFAVSKDTKKPVSLRNIEKEVGHEIDRTLKSWRDQGVFLLNTALTVKNGKAGSHLTEWLGFMTHVLNIISKEINPIWVLWGLKAQSFLPMIDTPQIAYSPLVLKAPHPAAEAYAGGNAGFFGCNHFSLINNILIGQGKTIINF